MTIDHLDAHLEVSSPGSPTAGQTGAGGSGGGPMSPQAASAQGLRELKELLRPLVNEIVAEELRMHLRMQGR